MEYELEDIKNHFKLPIEFLEKINSIDENTKKDLELISNDENKCIYDYIFENSSKYSKTTSNMWNNYYTYDKQFILDTQILLKKFKVQNTNFQQFDSWETIKQETSFIDKYQYIDIEWFNFLNKSPLFLQIMSIYKFISPIISLIYPIFMLIVPYIVIRFNKIPISFNQYCNLIKLYLYNTAVGQLFTSFNTMNLKNKLYLLFTVGFYFFGIYQNIYTCIHFFNNMKSINNYIIELHSYINNTLEHMDNFILQYKKFEISSYKPFIDNLNSNRDILSSFNDKIINTSVYKWNYHNISNMGYNMQQFYEIFHNETLHKSLMYSFGFKGYIQNIIDLQTNIKNKHINFVKFSKVTSFKDAYYPVFKNKKHIKNTYSLNKNIIISGSNASGKTTILKTTIINVILSHQIGIGFFKSGKTKLYTNIHCYLNIPDTSDRDSLFQAEARRCVNIIESLKQTKGNHFCIFDELYSGTNPYEAVASAYSFINYIRKCNIDFMLTTHYFELCDELNNKKFICNKHMLIDNENDTIKYLYKIKKGVSKYKGGVQVLKNLKYPPEIVINAIKYLNK